MSECTHDCGSCSENCASRKDPNDFHEDLHEGCRVNKVIGVISGKGGVGKSMVTSLLASAVQKAGRQAAVLDADITGPSIPKAFGITEKATGDGECLFPSFSRNGVQIMSINLLLEDAAAPVVWRGPVISGTVKQFWTQVLWKDVDYMFVDMPPGTGDVPLTVFQSLPLDGIIVVTSPQELVSMIVNKAVAMARMMNVPILGIVENMSYVACPDCGRRIEVFGKSHVKQVAEDNGLPLLAELPMDPALAAACDEGRVETADAAPLAGTVQMLLEMK
ncbi:MAG: Mrp/NBP35 family ATP-binding protein [Eubacteriales bacterium]|nr:Mrp/NBP35 family ATP-binding protein [Eubacteriales bacterium]